MNTARAIEALRRSLRTSQADFAAKLETTITTVSRWENGKVEPNREALKRLSKIAAGAGLDYLGDFFEAQRRASIQTRISKLPSPGTGRHVALDELKTINGGLGAVEKKLSETRQEYINIISRVFQHLTEAERKKYYDANSTAFALTHVLQDLRKRIEPYIATVHPKKTKGQN